MGYQATSPTTMRCSSTGSSSTTRSTAGAVCKMQNTDPGRQTDDAIWPRASGWEHAHMRRIIAALILVAASALAAPASAQRVSFADAPLDGMPRDFVGALTGQG